MNRDLDARAAALPVPRAEPWWHTAVGAAMLLTGLLSFWLVLP